MTDFGAYPLDKLDTLKTDPIPLAQRVVWLKSQEGTPMPNDPYPYNWGSSGWVLIWVEDTTAKVTYTTRGDYNLGVGIKTEYGALDKINCVIKHETFDAKKGKYTVSNTGHDKGFAGKRGVLVWTHLHGP